MRGRSVGPGLCVGRAVCALSAERQSCKAKYTCASAHPLLMNANKGTRITIAAVAVILLGHLVSSGQDGDDPVSLVQAPTPRVRDLACDVHIAINRDCVLGTAGVYDLRYTLKVPGQTRVELESQEADGLLRPAPAEGCVYLLQEDSLLVYNPMAGTTQMDAARAGDAPLQPSSTPSNLPSLEAYLHSLGLAFSSKPLSLRVTGTQKRNGLECTVVEAALSEPVRLFEPHHISRYRWWIDPSRHLIVASAAYDGQGKAVVSTDNRRIQQIADGKWVSLEAITTVQPGEASLRVEVPDRAQPVQTSLYLEGYRVETVFTWLAEHGMRLPRTRLYTTLDGEALATVTFTEYALDQGLPTLQLRSGLR